MHLLINWYIPITYYQVYQVSILDLHKTKLQVKPDFYNVAFTDTSPSSFKGSIFWNSKSKVDYR